MPDDVYTHGHHETVLRSHVWRTAENSAAYLLPHLEPGMKILDIGCGPGNITRELAARVAPGRVVGLDRSEDVIGRATADDETGAVEFVTGDVYALDFEDGSFDVVHAHQVLQHLSDPVAALVEMSRVAGSDGLVAIRDADYAAMTWFPESPVLDHWLATYRAVARSNGAEPDAGRRLSAWARQAGAERVDLSVDTWLFATAEDRAFWGGMWAGRVTDSDIGRQAVADGLATAEDVHRWADAWRSWSAHPDGWFVVVNGEALIRG